VLWGQTVTPYGEKLVSVLDLTEVMPTELGVNGSEILLQAIEPTSTRNQHSGCVVGLVTSFGCA
jgi:hypothetical protein